MSTIHTVAARAGVSSATVSRVMNEPHKVRETTRLKVEQAMRELDFSRNSFAAWGWWYPICPAPSLPPW